MLLLLKRIERARVGSRTSELPIDRLAQCALQTSTCSRVETPAEAPHAIAVGEPFQPRHPRLLRELGEAVVFAYLPHHVFDCFTKPARGCSPAANASRWPWPACNFRSDAFSPTDALETMSTRSPVVAPVVNAAPSSGIASHVLARPRSRSADINDDFDASATTACGVAHVSVSHISDC